tara:strand:+ start:86 stop:337 length:252 start_codon:yes stop_codon:yes gene_type:complete
MLKQVRETAWWAVVPEMMVRIHDFATGIDDVLLNLGKPLFVNGHVFLWCDGCGILVVESSDRSQGKARGQEHLISGGLEGNGP